MQWWEIVLGGSLMAMATVLVAVITTRANRAVERLRSDVERQRAATAERSEDRARYEGLLAGMRSDLNDTRTRLAIVEARDREHMGRVLRHMPWDTRAEEVAERAGVLLGDAPPLL